MKPQNSDSQKIRILLKTKKGFQNRNAGLDTPCGKKAVSHCGGVPEAQALKVNVLCDFLPHVFHLCLVVSPLCVQAMFLLISPLHWELFSCSLWLFLMFYDFVLSVWSGELHSWFWTSACAVWISCHWLWRWWFSQKNEKSTGTQWKTRGDVSLLLPSSLNVKSCLSLQQVEDSNVPPSSTTPHRIKDKVTVFGATPQLSIYWLWSKRGIESKISWLINLWWFIVWYQVVNWCLGGAHCPDVDWVSLLCKSIFFSEHMTSLSTCFLFPTQTVRWCEIHLGPLTHWFTESEGSQGDQETDVLLIFSFILIVLTLPSPLSLTYCYSLSDVWRPSLEIMTLLPVIFYSTARPRRKRGAENGTQRNDPVCPGKKGKRQWEWRWGGKLSRVTEMYEVKDTI